MPNTGSGKPLESTVGVRKWWASRNDAGMSTKLSSRVAKGVGSGEREPMAHARTRQDPWMRPVPQDPLLW